jgi:phosphomannomutase
MTQTTAQLNPKIFKAYDIRAIYPTELNEEGIKAIAKAIFVFFSEKLSTDRQLKIVLGYDMRLSGPQLFGAVKDTLVEMGAEVIDIGMVSTPSFYFAVSHYGYDAGIQVTASHNPKEYNGMKFVMNSPEGLIKIGKATGMDYIKEMALNGIDFTPKYTGKVTPKANILEDEVEVGLQLLDNPEIKKFKIVADPANAMGATYIEALFKKVLTELIKMNFELDGSFPSHQPDPLNFDNLKDLQAKVLEEHADLGLAPDGDGDRLYFIDEKGQVVSATLITALVARELLKENPGATILFDIRYILGSQKIVEEFGGKSVITRVGHAFITEQLGKTGGIFAGESSGHFYFKANGNAESQIATIISVLKVLTEEGKTLSEVVKELKRSYESGELNFRVANAPEILTKLKEKYADGELNEMDGIAITYPEWRFSVRTSNTEPLLRLNLEAFTEDVMKEKFAEVKDYIQVIGQHEEHTGH